jgi:hypothetical protein
MSLTNRFKMYNLTLLFSSVALSFLVAPLSVTLYICLEKWGAIEYLQLHRKKLYPLPVDCAFCSLFWLCFILSLPIPLIFPPEIFYITVPFAAVSLAKVIYESSKTKHR